jgi:hypothetical protein
MAHYEVYKARKQDRARERAAAKFKEEERLAAEHKETEAKLRALQAEKKTAEVSTTSTAATTSAASTMTADSTAPLVTKTTTTEHEKEIKKER